MIVSTISDHALLRWMERRHGIPIETWRELMLADVTHDLAAYDGNEATRGPAYIITTDGSHVVTYISSGCPIRGFGDRVAIQALQSETEEAA